RTEIEDRPALRIGRAAEDLGEARPGQADLEQRVLEVQRREPCGAKLSILLLRVLQDKQRHLVVDPRDSFAHAQRLRLKAARAFGVRIGCGRLRRPGGGLFGHWGRYTPGPGHRQCARLDELLADANANAESIAKRERCSIRKVNMTISLAFLTPDLVTAAIAGRLPHGMGVARLTDVPAEWSRQHQMLGLPSA